MAIDPNDEILKDFLVEAGELLEGLNEQLIELEQNPEDRDLLNSVFRSFHTIKGGAGFLNLANMVAVCHRAEDVFNLLRNGERRVDPFLMDTVLRVLDVLNVMFGSLQNGEEPEAASDGLLSDLDRLAVPATGEAETAPVQTTASEPAPAVPAPSGSSADQRVGGGDELSDADYQRLVSALDENGSAPAKPAVQAQTVQPETGASGEAITEAEFDALLDRMHGSKQPKAAPAPTPAQSSPPVTERPAPIKAPPAASSPPPPTPSAGAAAKPATRPQAPVAETSVRVDTERLDEIMNLVGELVLVRNRLSMLRSRGGDDEIGKAIGALALVTADLQTAVMKTRMQPIRKVFGRFPRVVRDLARNLGKEIELETFGEDTDLDKNLVEALADPLVHLVRNAVDHGIELPQEREARGKPRKGTLTLGAAQEGDHISLIIEDDGRGMDPQLLREKAVAKGLLDSIVAERMSDRDSFNLIFMAGFSTKEQISDVSGRGVGMDVVKTRIAQLNGSVEIDSELGRGTRLRVKLPLTLAILPALMVIVDGRRFAIPLASVSEILELDLTKSHSVDDQETIMVRGHALPLAYVRRWVCPDRPTVASKEGHVVVVHVAQRKIGLVVDGLVGQEEVVIKPLGMGLQGVSGLAGATITGDGGIALIIDVPELMTLLSKAGPKSGSRDRVRKVAEIA